MSLNHPLLYFGVGVLAAVAASFLAAAAEKRGHARWKHAQIFLSPILIAVSAWALWQGQERVSQRWNSQVIFDASADNRKNLVLRNLGQVPIEDVKIFATVYRMKAHLDKYHHMLTDGLSSFSKIGGGAFGGALIALPKIDAGDSKTVTLSAFGNLLPFYDFNSVLGKDMHDAFLDHYCLRITFRNAITKKKHAYYVLLSPLTGTSLPDMIDSGDMGSMGGPFDMKFFKYRADIRRHQAELFDEVEDHLYRDKEAR